MDVKPPKGWLPKCPSPESTEKPETAEIVPPTVAGPEVDLGLAEPEKQPKKHWSLWKKIVLLAIVFFVVVFGSIAGWFYWAISPVSQDLTRQSVAIELGMSPTEIANLLKRKGLIRSEQAFNWYLSWTGKGNQLRAGQYKFAPNQSVSDLINSLTDPKGSVYNVIILPGMTLKQLADPNIKNSLADQGFSAQEIKNALGASYKSLLLKDRPAGASLEGYIFPETYQLEVGNSLESLFERSFDELYGKIEKDALTPIFQSRGFNLHQTLTLASMVQKETDDPEIQKQVAQVFLKRLQDGMSLGSDPTFMYAAAQLGVHPSVGIDSPYNTRKYSGLPPGPIANMNYSALQALAFPATGDFLYFVAGDDGKTYFSRTEAEHNDLVKKHCQKLCSEY